MAGTVEHFEHDTGDGRVTESFEFPVGPMAGSVVEARATQDYGYLRCIVTSPTVPLQVSLLDTPPGTWGRHVGWLPAESFEFLWVLSQQAERPSIPKWPLATPVSGAFRRRRRRP